jgi:hypothetical protein
MSSKIVIIGAGCASSMRARPAARSQHAGNPRERLRAVGPAVHPAGGPAAANDRRKWRRPATVVATPSPPGHPPPGVSLTGTRATAILSASPGRAA